MLDRIRTREVIPVLDVAKKITELDGNGNNVTHTGSYITQVHPSDPEHKYAAMVHIVMREPSLRVLASITYGSGRPTPFTPEEALLGSSYDFHIQSDAINVTPELIEQVRQSLGPLS